MLHRLSGEEGSALLFITLDEQSSGRKRGGSFFFIIWSHFRHRNSFPTGLKVCVDSEKRRWTSGPSADLSSDVHNAPHSSSLRWRCCPTLGHPACDLTAWGRARCTDALFIAELHSKHLYAFTGTVLPAGRGVKKEGISILYELFCHHLPEWRRISSQVVMWLFFFFSLMDPHGAVLFSLCFHFLYEMFDV